VAQKYENYLIKRALQWQKVL